MTGVTPGTQLHEVKRDHQDTKGCSVGSGLGINSQKRSQNSFQAQLRGCSTPSLGWAAGGEQRPELEPRPSPCPGLPQPRSCCQQPLTGTPGTFPEAFPGSFPRLVPGKLLWQSRIWVCSSPGCGRVHPSRLGSSPWCSQSQGRSYGDVVPNPHLLPAGAPGQAALVPWQLTGTLAQGFGLSLWTKGTHRGVKSCSSGSGNGGLMPG